MYEVSANLENSQLKHCNNNRNNWNNKAPTKHNWNN